MSHCFRGTKDRQEFRGAADFQGFPAEICQRLHPHFLRGFLQRPVGDERAFWDFSLLVAFSGLSIMWSHSEEWSMI